MSTVSAPTSCAESSTTPTESSGSPRAAYEAARAALQQHVSSMIPTGSECVVLKQKRERLQARIEKLSAAIASYISKYQQHRRHVISLLNSVLASQTALGSAPGSAPTPQDESQWLMHASLYHHFLRASEILIDLNIQGRRFQSASDRYSLQDQALSARSQALLKIIDEDSEKADELHAKVVEAALEIGEDPRCHVVEGRCANCDRNEERKKKKKKLATDNALEEKTRREKDGKGGEVENEGRKEVHWKQSLEDIIERMERRASAWV